MVEAVKISSKEIWSLKKDNVFFHCTRSVAISEETLPSRRKWGLKENEAPQEEAKMYVNGKEPKEKREKLSTGTHDLLRKLSKMVIKTIGKKYKLLNCYKLYTLEKLMTFESTT